MRIDETAGMSFDKAQYLDRESELKRNLRTEGLSPKQRV
jgi:hypothetical protein